MSAQPAQGTSSPTRQVRKPPFADWPTIKILGPPKGRFSPETDQYCFTYCSQSVSGRLSHQPPFCRSVCFRKVFPHEIRNVSGFKAHRGLGSDGVAKYPLPPEGQVENLPRALGGLKPQDPDDDEPSAEPPERRYWQEGWYLWSASSFRGVADQLTTMSSDFRQQELRRKRISEMRELWEEYEQYLRQHPNGPEPGPNGEPHRFWGPRPPAYLPSKEETDSSLLVPVPPGFPPFFERFTKLLEPTHKVLEIAKNSLTSGEQVEFAKRIWEKARSNEPFVLAGRTFEKASELWRQRVDSDDDEDDKKGSS